MPVRAPKTARPAGLRARACRAAATPEMITGSYETTLVVKLIVVIISGVTAALHAPAGLRARACSPAGRAVFGALTGISALAALFLGIVLAG